MEISIPAREDDDGEFVQSSIRFCWGLLKREAPAEAFVIRVHKWFDHRWLDFSGKGRVKYDGPFTEVALDEFRQDHTTFPPFR